MSTLDKRQLNTLSLSPVSDQPAHFHPIQDTFKSETLSTISSATNTAFLNAFQSDKPRKKLQGRYLKICGDYNLFANNPDNAIILYTVSHSLAHIQIQPSARTEQVHQRHSMACTNTCRIQFIIHIKPDSFLRIASSLVSSFLSSRSMLHS